MLQEGATPLSRFPNFGIHIPVPRLEKHKKIDRCEEATYMQLRWRDVGISQRSREMEFSLYGTDIYELVEGLTQFKYLGRPFDQY